MQQPSTAAAVSTSIAVAVDRDAGDVDDATLTALWLFQDNANRRLIQSTLVSLALSGLVLAAVATGHMPLHGATLVIAVVGANVVPWVARYVVVKRVRALFFTECTALQLSPEQAEAIRLGFRDAATARVTLSPDAPKTWRRDMAVATARAFLQERSVSPTKAPPTS